MEGRSWASRSYSSNIGEYQHPSFSLGATDSDSSSVGSATPIHNLPSHGSMTALSPLSSSRRKRSMPLSRRNSSVWLATVSMDVHQMQRTPMGSSSQLSGLGLSSGLTALTKVHSDKDKPRLDNLPIEILTVILQYVASDANGLENLYRLLSTCGRLYDVGVAALYRHIIFKYPQTFEKFHLSIEDTGYGQHVRVLDFSAFTSVGLGRTSRMNMEIQMVAETTIHRVLELCPSLNEFLAAESIDTDMPSTVIDKLLTMPVLNTLDFCGATDPTFVKGLQGSLLMSPDFPLWNLTKLCLHGCSTVPPHVLESIMSKLVNVTRLDLTHTQITEQGLLALPQSAKLTHVSIARCVQLTSHSIVKFLVLHPATKKLRWLSLLFEITKPIPLSRHDFDTIMRFLPRSIRHLDISGLPVTEQHLYMINLDQIRSVSIRYADIGIKALQRFLTVCPHLRYIDITGIAGVTAWTVQDRSFLNANENIEMFEVSQEILARLKGVHIPGFVINPGRGRRGWIHRLKPRMGAADQPQQVAERPRQFSFAQHAIERMNRAKAPASVEQPRDHPPPASDPVWRFPSHKINVSEIGIGGVATPAVFEHEGIYNYYALNTI